MLDHLPDLEQDVLEEARHPGEAAVVSATMNRFRESAQWQSELENASPGMVNRYFSIVAMGDAVIDQQCDVHDLCEQIQELVPKLLPDYSLHCRILSPPGPTEGLHEAIAPKILTGRVGVSAGIVVLDGHPPAR